MSLPVEGVVVRCNLKEPPSVKTYLCHESTKLRRGISAHQKKNVLLFFISLNLAISMTLRVETGRIGVNLGQQSLVPMAEAGGEG